jgi:AcrR family transcriptional regulator
MVTYRRVLAVGQIQDPGTATLTERKRAVTRSALSEAALRLALERGLEHVLVQDIAAAAGVSARTFNNYFSSKEEAAAAPAFDRMARVLAAFGQRPAAEPLWEAVTQAILAQFPDADPDPGMAAQARLISSSPGLWGEQLKMYATIESLLADAVAERLGGAAEGGLLPRLVAGAAITASRVAFDHWLDSQDGASLRSLLAVALGQFGTGFPLAGERSQ